MTQTDHADVERALRAACASQPSDRARALMDARVAAALAADPTSPRRIPRSPRAMVLALGLVAALVTVAAGGSTLLDRMFRGADPGDALAWRRATPLGLSHTVRGVSVGVERAYMDGAQIIIGLTSAAQTYAGATLRVDGRRAMGGVSHGGPTRQGSAHVLVFDTPPGVGSRASLELVVPNLWDARGPAGRTGDGRPSPGVSPMAGGVTDTGPFHGRERIAGPWRFAFQLENHGGTGWRGQESATAAGVTVTLRRLVVTPTMIRAYVSWRGDPLRASEDDVWTASGTLEHAGDRFRSGGGATNGNRGEVAVDRGTDDPAGAWTIRIDSLASDPGYPPTHVTIDGPWVFRIDVPPDGDPSL